MRVPRTRGAVSGLAIALLGLWGALIPFVGPSFDYAIGSTDAWHWSAGRFWLSVLPGVVAIVGGLVLMTSSRRPTASLGAIMGVAAGAWFIVGPTVSRLWNDGVSQAGALHGSNTTQVFAELGWFLALGALILYFAAAALGRLSVKSVRDIELSEAEQAPATTEPAGDVGTTRATGRGAGAGFRTRRGGQPSTPSNPPAQQPGPPAER
jgi:hypothetical protein